MRTNVPSIQARGANKWINAKRKAKDTKNNAKYPSSDSSCMDYSSCNEVLAKWTQNFFWFSGIRAL
jgi:hypothetical protein